MDRLLSLEIFTAVAKAGSFTAVAETFAITPAMVGKHIKQLEAQVGATLIRRSTRKQSLTEIGEDYLQGCQKILTEFAVLEQKTAVLKNAPTGILRINAPTTFGSLMLSPLICDFLDLHAQLQIELVLSDQMVDVLHDGFDAVFRIGELEDAPYIGRKICDYDLVYCASPAYLNNHGVPTSLQSLEQHQCLSFVYKGKPSTLVTELATDAFDKDHSRFRSNNGVALKQAALKGWGILLQPRVLVENELLQGSLIELLSDYAPAPRPVHLLYASREHQSLKLKLFIDYICATYRYE